MISVSHLTRRFGAFVAIDDLSFDIAEGEVVGFLGPNGAGKTTTMRILAGYLPATSGSARIAGFDVLRQSMDVRRRIGYLPESVALYREHRVREMLAFQARLHGLSRAQMRTRIPAVLESVGVLDRANDLVGHLSRGLRQRVGLAVALLPDPKVLILDEPTSGLDPLQRIEVRGLIQNLAQRHTVLLSSHILPEIEFVCPRVIVLNRGRIAADGTQSELVRQFASASHVRLEAVVGPDLAAAQRLLRAIAGVKDVRDAGRLGVHHQFDIVCDEDLREDVGAIAASRGWALRELSWRRPTLEEIFASITTGALASEGDAAASERSRAAEPVPVAVTSGAPSSSVAATAARAVAAPIVAGPAVGPSAPSNTHGPRASDALAQAPRKVVYNLNPFDMGATRDLGRPKAIESPAAPAPTASETAPSRSDPPSMERSGPSDPAAR